MRKLLLAASLLWTWVPGSLWANGFAVDGLRDGTEGSEAARLLLFSGLSKARRWIEGCARDAPRVRGSARYTFDVAQTGEPRAITVRDEDMEDARFVSCLKKAIGRARFRRLEGGTLSVTLDLFADEGLVFPIALEMTARPPTEAERAIVAERLKAGRALVRAAEAARRKKAYAEVFETLDRIESGSSIYGVVGRRDPLASEWAAVETAARALESETSKALARRARASIRARRFPAAEADVEALEGRDWPEAGALRETLDAATEAVEAERAERDLVAEIRRAQSRWPAQFERAKAACARMMKAKRHIREAMVRGREAEAERHFAATKKAAEGYIEKMRILVQLSQTIFQNRTHEALVLSPLQVAERLRGLTALCSD